MFEQAAFENWHGHEQGNLHARPGPQLNFV